MHDVKRVVRMSDSSPPLQRLCVRHPRRHDMRLLPRRRPLVELPADHHEQPRRNLLVCRALLHLAHGAAVKLRAPLVYGVAQLWAELRATRPVLQPDLGQATLDRFGENVAQKTQQRLPTDRLPVAGAGWPHVLACVGERIEFGMLELGDEHRDLIGVVPMRIDGNVVAIACWSKQALFLVTMLTS